MTLLYMLHIHELQSRVCNQCVYVPDVTHTKHGVHKVTLLVRFTLAPC